MKTGKYALVLHTHLPWVMHHGTWPHGSDWLCEAVAECYIPLLNVFNELMAEGICPNVTIDISPILCEQLENTDFKDIFTDYCDQKIEAARQDEKSFKDMAFDPHHIYLTEYWQQWYEQRKQDFIKEYDSSIVKSLKKLQDSGAIEILTCGATHGYLPLLGDDSSVNLQVKCAVENYKKHFGRYPKGIWLPECAYRPSYEWHSYIPVHPFDKKKLRSGIEQFLSAHGISHFITDEPLIANSTAIGKMDNGKFINADSYDYKYTKGDFDRSPLKLYNITSSAKIEFGTAVAFTRFHDLSMQVWSGQLGYPGEPDYLDFHKKHLGSMLRYWRVTDNKADMMYKLLYHPDWTARKIDLQSNHFIHHLENTANWHHRTTGKQATICTPFDTELFGHWWFEGPEFIKAVIKGLHDSPYIDMVTTSQELALNQPREYIRIPEGSWGEHNNHDVWINEKNKWTWEAIYNDEKRFKDILASNPIGKMSDRFRSVITQALRELMLEQASDWQFLITNESARDYAEQRFSFHHSDFNKLCDIAESLKATGYISSHEEYFLAENAKRNPIFPELNIEWWHELEF